MNRSTLLALCACVVFLLCSSLAHAQRITLTERWIEERVRAQSPTVRAQQAAARAAETEQLRAQRALVPEVTLQGRYTRLSSIPEQFRRIELGPPGMSAPGEALVFPQLLDQFVARATLTIPLSDLFLRGLPTLRAAGMRAEAARLEARAAEARAVYEAQQAHLGWLRARAAVAIAQRTYENFEQQRADVARRVEAGQLARSQLLPLEVTASSLRRQQLSLEGTLRASELALRALLALENEPIEVPEDERASEVPSGTPPVRPEVAAIDANVRALDAQERALHGALVPSLAVVGSVDVAAPNPRVFVQTSLVALPTWDVSVQLSWSLGQTLDTEAQLRGVYAQRASLVAQREALTRSIEAEVRSAQNEWALSLRRREEAERGLAAAEALAVQRRGAFSVGAATATELALAEGELLRQRLEVVDAQLEARSARVKLRYLFGAFAL